MPTTARHRTPRRAAMLAVVATGSLALPVAASAADSGLTGFPTPLPAGGDGATTVAAGHGTLAWLSTGDETSTDASATLHVRDAKTGAISETEVGTTRDLARLSVGTDADGGLVVLAISYSRARTSGYGHLSGGDGVRIDPRTGRVTKLRAASRSNVDESAVSVDDGRLLVARRADRGTGRAALYLASLEGSKLERQRSLSFLARPKDAEITGVAVSPSTSGSDTTFAFRADGADSSGEFSEERLYTARGTHTPRLVHRAPTGGANFASIPGFSWETGSRLWFDRGNTSTPGNRIYRYSTSTRRTSEANSDRNVGAFAYVGGEVGAVAAPLDDVYAEGDAKPASSRNLYLSGRVALKRTPKD